MFSSFADVCFAVKSKSTGKHLLLTGKTLRKFRKTVYGKIFHKPFSKTHSHRPPTPSLISVAQTHPPLLTFLHWSFADLVILDFLALGLRRSGHFRLSCIGASPIWLLGFAWLCHASAIDAAPKPDPTRQLRGAVGLELGRAVMVGLWVCCDGGFVGFFMVVCSGLRWWVCTLQWVSEFFFFFFFHFTLLRTL